MSSTSTSVAAELKITKDKRDESIAVRQHIDSVSVPEKLATKVLDTLKSAFVSPIKSIQTALEQERQHRQARSAEIALHVENAQTAVAALAASKESKEDIGKLKADVLTKLLQNLELNDAMNRSLEQGGFKPGATAGKDTSFHISHNKTSFIIPGAQKFVQDNFETIFLQGKIPTGFAFDYQPGDISFIGNNPVSIWGNPKGSELTTAALTTSLVCKQVNRFDELANLGKNKFSFDKSVLIYNAQFAPEFVISNVDKRVTQFSYTYSIGKSETNNKEQFGYCAIHGGYVYGGQRKTFQVYSFEDCTSWTSKITSCPIIYTSLELRDFYNGTMTEAARATALATVYEPKKIQDPQRDIQPGSLYWQPGHTALVLGFISAEADSQVVGLAFSRDIPNRKDGFGVQLFPYTSDPSKLLIFSPKGAAAETSSLPETSANQSAKLS